MKKFILLLLVSVFSYANADDNGWEGDAYMPGPGILSGESGEFDMVKLFSTQVEKKAESAESKTEEASVVIAKKNDAVEKLEEKVQQAEPAVEQKPVPVDYTKTSDYQEYLEYKKFLEWKRLNGG